MKTLVALFLLILVIGLTLFVGKTQINLDSMEFKIQRPLTASLFFATVLAAMIEEKFIEYFFD